MTLDLKAAGGQAERVRAYGFTVFIGAFLLFQLQPLIGKYLLPWFGGGPGVWMACMLFFQTLLVVGYAYAHALSQYCRPRVQCGLHVLLLASALATLPIVPTPGKAAPAHSPALAILLLLAGNVGVPYFLLSTTGPLLQRWYSASYLRPPYHLYSLSNLGSLLGLISYPVFFEIRFSRRTQLALWESGLALYCTACAFCAWNWFRTVRQHQLRGPLLAPAPAVDSSQSASEGDPSTLIARRLLWLLWPACSSVLLLAVTNKLCLDVAAVPFLWVLPLSVYLASYIICFAGPGWWKPVSSTVAFGLAATVVCWALLRGVSWPFWGQLCAYVVVLFVCCLSCHGELYRLRPPAEALTSFYLFIAAGGALGALFVSVIAPRVFTEYYELHWGLMAGALLFALARTLAILRTPQPQGRVAPAWNSRDWRVLGLVSVWLGFFALSSILWLQARRPGTEIVHKSRNFFGVLTVFEHRRDVPNGHHLLLQHGRITHGLQFVLPQLQSWPTTYYGPDSGVGRAFQVLPDAPRRIGVLGLGTGTLAAYCRPGDFLHFYEINAEVEALAHSRFTYLSNCQAKCTVTLGDARLSLQQQAAQGFDLLAVDVFSSDSIPLHLLTCEAFALYLRHVKPNGLIAVHVSNHFLDLEPVLAAMARHFHLYSAVIDHDAKPDQWWIYSSTWVLLSRDGQLLQQPAIRSVAKSKSPREIPLWTDDFNNLLQILR